MNGGNTLRVAMALAANKSVKGTALGQELFQRSELYPKLTGALILAGNNQLPKDAFQQGGVLSSILSGYAEVRPNDYLPEKATDPIIRTEAGNSDAVMLVLMAAQYSKDQNSILYILPILTNRVPYHVSARAAEALGEIGDERAIPALETAMKSQTFYALPEAFEALVKLSSEQAVPLAIERVSPKLKGYNSGQLIKSLEMHTGRNFGFERVQWQNWWNDTHK